MRKILNLDSWKRKEHFEFFSKFEEPFLGIVTEINCTSAYKHCKENNLSFFSYYLHKSLIAVNETESFRYRVEGDQIFIYDEVHGSATILRADETFGFSFIPYQKDFTKFEEGVKKGIEEVQHSTGLRLDKVDAIYKNLIHYSSIPWVKITGLTHARNFKYPDSSPKITFGKIFSKGTQSYLPISINIHHGLADGLHVAQHLELFQTLMNEV